MSLRLRLMLEWFFIGALASIIVFFALNWRGAASFDHLLYDQLSSINRPVADNNILLVTIDDESLAQIGKWPWPREIHADTVTKIKAAAPRSVTLDILFSEKGDDNADRQLVEALAAPPSSFVPLHFVSPGSDGRAYNTEWPLKAITDAAKGVGHVNLEFDIDGSVRRAALCFAPEEGGLSWPHLMELVFRGNNQDTPSTAYNRTECGQPLLFPYAERGSFSEISYSSLVGGEVPAELLKGRDIIVGATAAGMGDSYPVPYADGGLLSGSEIMGNMLTALRQDSFIRPLGYATTLLLSLVPIWLLLFIFLSATPRTALFASVTFIALLLLGSAAALGRQIWFAPSAALIGIFLIYPLWGWRRLQAVSSFMDRELSALEKGGEVVPFSKRQSLANDIVGRQSAALSNAINQIRDLRRFVGDVLSDLPDPMLVTNLEGRVTLVSAIVQQRFGRSIIGEKISDIMKEAALPKYWPTIRDFLATPLEQVRPKDFIRFDTIDDRTFVMRQSAAEDDNAQLIGKISYLADISALAEAEVQREKVLQLLSHDMRAPQSAIIASLDGDIDSAARSRIERNARRTMRLAQDFVDMARMEETQFKGEEILLIDLARDVSDNLWPLAEERQVKIEIDEKVEAAFVLAEPESLSRAISNLFDNAIKFSPKESKIDVTLRRIKIEQEAYLSLSISDAGPGIDENMLPRLFTRFATSDREKRRANGSGLGLTYVEAVAKRHSGNITAENQRAGGAIFTLLLPEAIESPDTTQG